MIQSTSSIRTALLRTSVLLLLWTTFSPLGLPQDRSAVKLIPLEDPSVFPAAIEPKAIQSACGSDRQQLAEFFAARGLPFDAKLARNRRGHGLCHIYYEPTIPGFRAAVEEGDASDLYAAVDPLGFIGHRQAAGDTLDILKAVLTQIQKPLNVWIGVNSQFDSTYWAASSRFHFPDTQHRIQVAPHPGAEIHPWAQDHLKAGQANGELRVLVPRRLFEGRKGDGEVYGPLLDAIMKSGKHFVRSKISWEGGDLLFAADPRKPGQSILFFGGAARGYWAAGLTHQEYEYVLRTEFGADRAVDLSMAGPHADFLVSILPGTGIVLVADPVRERYAIAQGAVTELKRAFGRRTPKELSVLESYLNNPQERLARDSDGKPRLTRTLLSILSKIPAVPDPQLDADLDAYALKHCSGRPEACLDLAGRRQMLARDPELFRRIVNAALVQESEAHLGPRLLGLIEAQLPDELSPLDETMEAKAVEIRNLGFRVIRAPYLPSTEPPGISYVNVFAQDGLLFVGTFGLGPAEDRLISDFQKELGGTYRIIPVDARFSLLHNGGVHCALGVLREQPSSVRTFVQSAQ